jgi:hypothetical protein
MLPNQFLGYGASGGPATTSFLSTDLVTKNYVDTAIANASPYYRPAILFWNVTAATLTGSTVNYVNGANFSFNLLPPTGGGFTLTRGANSGVPTFTLTNTAPTGSLYRIKVSMAVSKGNNNTGYVIGGVTMSTSSAQTYDATPAYGTGATSVWVPSTALGGVNDRHQLVCETFTNFASPQTQYINMWVFTNGNATQVGGNTFIEVQRMN